MSTSYFFTYSPNTSRNESTISNKFLTKNIDLISAFVKAAQPNWLDEHPEIREVLIEGGLGKVGMMIVSAQFRERLDPITPFPQQDATRYLDGGDERAWQRCTVCGAWCQSNPWPDGCVMCDGDGEELNECDCANGGGPEAPEGCYIHGRFGKNTLEWQDLNTDPYPWSNQRVEAASHIIEQHSAAKRWSEALERELLGSTTLWSKTQGPSQYASQGNHPNHMWSPNLMQAGPTTNSSQTSYKDTNGKSTSFQPSKPMDTGDESTPSESDPSDQSVRSFLTALILWLVTWLRDVVGRSGV